MEVHFDCHVIDSTDEKRCTQVLALTVIYQDLWISFENCLGVTLSILSVLISLCLLSHTVPASSGNVH